MSTSCAVTARRALLRARSRRTAERTMSATTTAIPAANRENTTTKAAVIAGGGGGPGGHRSKAPSSCQVTGRVSPAGGQPASVVPRIMRPADPSVTRRSGCSILAGRAGRLAWWCPARAWCGHSGYRQDPAGTSGGAPGGDATQARTGRTAWSGWLRGPVARDAAEGRPEAPLGPKLLERHWRPRATSSGTSSRLERQRVPGVYSPGGPASRSAASHLQGPKLLTTQLDHLPSLVPTS